MFIALLTIVILLVGAEHLLCGRPPFVSAGRLIAERGPRFFCAGWTE